MKIVTVVGARPQFIKAAMVSRAIAAHNQEHPDEKVVEEIIHTGQHYDLNMSDVFFEEMTIPPPAVRLECGAMSHGAMTGRMLEAIEKEIRDREPDWVLVYGDTNSTLAGALAAAKMRVPIGHVEAGLRSFNRQMPEEINRVLTDHVSTMLFCPTTTAVENLTREGITENAYQVGDVMYDATLYFSDIANKTSHVLDELHLDPNAYCLATVHRQENTEDPARLKAIFEALGLIATDERPVVLPLHPRTRDALLRYGMVSGSHNDPEKSGVPEALHVKNEHVHLIPPASFLDMVMLERHARIILTDSGGVQKEAYWHRVPCVTLREETEWVETVEAGWNRLVGIDSGLIRNVVSEIEEVRPPAECPALFGEGRTAASICSLLLKTRRN